jgi:[acyl-carrier-protein] S-malonyltransferase
MVKDKKLAFLFPGQGAQYQGMGLDFLAEGGEYAKLFALASDITGRDMQALLRDSDAETLKRTDVSQPAITLVNLAAAACLAEQGIRPAACAGFSLGEYAALAVAGVVSTEDCFRLVKSRGEAMQAAADRIRGEAGQDGAPGMAQPPGMAAVIGLPPDQVEALIAEWTAGGLTGLYAANINSPLQVVIAGTATALAEAERRFKDAGARRIIRLQVAGPFHSPLIADAAEKFRPVLEAAVFHDPSLPLFSNVTGRQVGSGAEAKALALRQVIEPLRWVQEEAALNSLGYIEGVLEVGPGKVLQGLWKDSGSALPAYAAGTVHDIQLLNKPDRGENDIKR